MNLLITSVGSNVSIGIIKAIRMQSGTQDIRVFGTDTHQKNECPGTSWVNDFITISPASDREKFERELIDIITQNKINCVIPVHDIEIDVASQLKIKYSDITFWAVNDPAVIKVCNNKLLSAQHAVQTGMQIPCIFNPDSIVSIEFPVIAKPLNGNGSLGIRIFFYEDEFRAFLNHATVSDYIFQEFIQGGMEYTVDCYSAQSGKFYGGIARQRIETKAGISTKGKTVEHPQLLDDCRRFLDGLNYCGASCLQFIEKGNERYFLEINPRFAAAGILSYTAHFNSPVFTLLDAENKPLPSFGSLQLQFGLTMTRYWEEQFAG